MRQSGGQVTIESEVGSGTVVRLYLPRMGGGQSRSNVEDGFETIPRGRGETVLVVEDDDDVRTLACAQLISLGYRVVEAQNGAEALDKMAAEESFDVVLCDMVMPGGFSGPDMLERTRRGGGGTPFIFMSGYPGQKVPEAVDGERGPPVLAKPFRMVDLARALRAMLDGGAA